MTCKLLQQDQQKESRDGSDTILSSLPILSTCPKFNNKTTIQCRDTVFCGRLKCVFLVSIHLESGLGQCICNFSFLLLFSLPSFHFIFVYFLDKISSWLPTYFVVEMTQMLVCHGCVTTSCSIVFLYSHCGSNFCKGRSPLKI